MKFLITWQTHRDKGHDVFKTFARLPPDDARTKGGSKIKLLARYHDLARFRGIAICETDYADALFTWALAWNQALDLEVTPVLDDDEVRALGRQGLV